MNAYIDWEAVVRSHQDYVTHGPDFASGIGVCLRDGCGTACFYGRDAWLDAAKFLGFPNAYSQDIRRTDKAAA